MLDESTGALALVIDKWDEKEVEKGHTLSNMLAEA